MDSIATNDNEDTNQYITLKDISNTLQGNIKALASIYYKFVIEDLSFMQDPNNIQCYGDKYYMPIKDKDSNQATLVYSQAVLDRAKEAFNIDIKTSIDIWIQSMYLNNKLSLIIIAGGIKEHGVSQQEIKRRKIIEYCTYKGYFNRIKKPLPTVIRKIAMITTDGSTITSDISEQIDFKKENIVFYRCSSNKESLNDMIKEVIGSNSYDVIALFRGGREDDAMFIFSETLVIDTIVNSPIPIITGLGHEIDNPIVQNIADVGYSTPTALAKEIKEHNLSVKRKSLEMFEQSNMFIHHFIKLLSSNIEHLNSLNSNLLSEQLSSKIKKTQLLKDNIQNRISYEIRNKNNECNSASKDIKSLLLSYFEEKTSQKIKESIYNKLIGKLTKKEIKLSELYNEVSMEIKAQEYSNQAKEDKIKNRKIIIIIIFTAVISLIGLYLIMK